MSPAVGSGPQNDRHAVFAGKQSHVGAAPPSLGGRHAAGSGLHVYVVGISNTSLR